MSRSRILFSFEGRITCSTLLVTAGVKRFHDRDLPGSRMFIGLLYELGFKEGKPGWNMYGADPRGEKQASS